MPNRAVVSDDGAVIRLMLYLGDVRDPVGVAELSVETAVRLAADLSAAAAARLARERNGRIGIVRGVP